MQSKDSLERFYAKPDPWKYETTAADAFRKERILRACNMFSPIFKGVTPSSSGYKNYRKALDIGAGEGWITKDLPADEIWGYELSDTAASRWPNGIRRIRGTDDVIPDSFDLVTLCGVLYPQYDYLFMALMGSLAASGIVVTCHIQGKRWECYRYHESKKVYEETFPYRNYEERLAVYDLAAA